MRSAMRRVNGMHCCSFMVYPAFITSSAIVMFSKICQDTISIANTFQSSFQEHIQCVLLLSMMLQLCLHSTNAITVIILAALLLHAPSYGRSIYCATGLR